MTRLKEFVARNVFSLTVLAGFLALVLGGFISWSYFGLFAAGWLTGLTVSYLGS